MEMSERVEVVKNEMMNIVEECKSARGGGLGGQKWKAGRCTSNGHSTSKRCSTFTINELFWISAIPTPAITIRPVSIQPVPVQSVPIQPITVQPPPR